MGNQCQPEQAIPLSADKPAENQKFPAKNLTQSPVRGLTFCAQHTILL